MVRISLPLHNLFRLISNILISVAWTFLVLFLHNRQKRDELRKGITGPSSESAVSDEKVREEQTSSSGQISLHDDEKKKIPTV